MIRLIRQALAKRNLARDKEIRQRLVGKPYLKRREAALKSIRGVKG